MTLTEADMRCITAAPIIARTDELTRPEWLKLRREGLGGSDAAAVLGISKWTSPYTLWLDKTGRLEPDVLDNSTLAARTGTALEAHVIAEAQNAVDGLHIDRAPYMLRHPDHPCLLANTDGLAWLQTRRTRGGAEAKTAEPMIAGQWADGVPAYYETQVYHYMGVTGLDWWIVAVLLGFGRLETYIVERNDEIIDALLAAEVAWWERHVLGDEPPPVDGSKVTTDALSLIEANAGATLVADPDELGELYQELAEQTAAAKAAEASVNTAKNRLRQILGDRTELVDPDGRTWATWRQARDATDIDWQAAAAQAAFSLGVPVADLAEPFTTTKPGHRTLRTTPGLNLIEKD